MHLKLNRVSALGFLIVFLVLGFAIQYCSADIPPVAINEGAHFTDSTTVTLTLNASTVLGSPIEPDAQMCINNDNLTWTNWESYSSPVTWLLTDGDGEKTVYVSFRLNSTSLSSDVSSSNITLDTTPPMLSLITPSSNLTETNSSTLQVEWTATDAGSGLNHTEIALDKGTWIDVGTNTTQVFTGLNNGAHTLDIKPTDNVGNYQTGSISFTVNIAVPTTTPTTTTLPTGTPTSSPTIAPTLTPTPSSTVKPAQTPTPPWIYFLVGALVAALATGILIVLRRRKRENAIHQTSSGSVISNHPKSSAAESPIVIPSKEPSDKRDREPDSTMDKISQGGIGKADAIVDSHTIKPPPTEDTDKKHSSTTSKTSRNIRPKQIETEKIILPRIDRVEPQTLEYTAHAKILIKGHNLNADKVLIRFGQNEPVAPSPNEISDSEISIVLPKEMEIGVNTVQAILQNNDKSGNVQREWLSNVSLIVLAPKIIRLVPTSIPRGSSLTITFEPMAAPFQQVTVLLGDAQFHITMGKKPGNEVSLKTPADFPVGNYIVRIRIGGADSFIHGDLPRVTIH